MKKNLFAVTLSAAMCLSSIPVYAEGSLANLNTKEGIIDVVGYEVQENENIVFIICEYQNTTDESASPMFQFNITAYQDGIELEHAYSSYEPDGCKSSSTKIKPGATLKYTESYALTSSSPVEVEVSPTFNFDDKYAECTLDLSSEMPAADSADEEVDYKEKYEELKTKYKRLKAKYEELQLKYEELTPEQ